MKIYTKKQLKELVKLGAATDVSAFHNGKINEYYTVIGIARGINGTTAKLMQGDSGKLYVAFGMAIYCYKQ